MGKIIAFLIFFMVTQLSFGQSLQLHYDARHTLDPKRNGKNFMTLYFEYYKDQDPGNSFVKPGSFLLKMQSDFNGNKGNMAKFYMQVSQSFKFWKPDIYLNLQYSGGLGITEPKQYSFYIVNAFSTGLVYPFQLGNAYLSAVLSFKHVPYDKPSNDALFTLYWWKGLRNYQFEFSGDFSVWTDNKNHGDEFTSDLSGKRFYFFAEPQLWYNVSETFAIGTKVNMYYHVLTIENIFQIYPTAAIECKL